MLFGRRIGSPENPPLVFLHGFLGDSQDWLPVARSLEKDFCCYLVDLPGHGRSKSFPANEVDPFGRFVQELKLFLEGKGVKEFGLVGYSMGGRLAFYTALRLREVVRLLIAESAHPGLNTPAERAARNKWEREIDSKLASMPFEEFLKEWYQMPIFAALAGKTDLLEKLLETRKGNSPSVLRKVFIDFSLSHQPDLTKELRRLTIPVLLLAGERDPKYRALYDCLANDMPNAKCVIVPGAGHNCHLEAEEMFSPILRNFLIENAEAIGAGPIPHRDSGISEETD